MFDEPSEEPKEPSRDPAERARDQADKFRTHAELAAVFEAVRKFGVQIIPGLDAKLTREIQQGMGRLEKSKAADSPVLPGQSMDAARVLLEFAGTHELSTGDYHIHRRPGEVMIVRWLAGEEVETFYQRLQAHFDAGLEGFREDERQAKEWQQDAPTLAYLDALDKVKVDMAERYLREVIRKHRIFVLSTQSADELNIAYLADHIMGVPAEEIVGGVSAPREEPTERDLAWFFKLFSLRGMTGGEERMCFFAYLQKSDDGMDAEE